MKCLYFKASGRFTLRSLQLFVCHRLNLPLYCQEEVYDETVTDLTIDIIENEILKDSA